MDKKDLIGLLSGIFISHGFKHKGNNWISDNDELIKIINLQKSNFSNSYYINYGYVIKGLQLTTTTHVANRLHGNNLEEGKRIKELLTIDSDIVDNERLLELEKIILDKIINKFQLINTPKDLKEDLKKRPHLNDIPGVVQQYFNL